MIVLAANKCDSDDKRVVTKAMGERLAASKGIPFFETSAKSGVNINEVNTHRGAHCNASGEPSPLCTQQQVWSYCFYSILLSPHIIIWPLPPL